MARASGKAESSATSLEQQLGFGSFGRVPGFPLGVVLLRLPVGLPLRAFRVRELRGFRGLGWFFC